MASGLLRVVVVGAGGVGKSALTIQFLRGKFVEDYDPTIEECYRKDMIVDNKPQTVEILDTAGQEEYVSIRDKYLRRGDGYICVYSITYEPTLREVENFYERIQRIKDVEHFPLVIAGNKADLEESRAVEREAGGALAHKIGCPFYETSAKTRQNVEEIFVQIVREVLKQKKPPEPEPAPTTTPQKPSGASTPSQPAKASTSRRGGICNLL